jgi:hypothetical protein
LAGQFSDMLYFNPPRLRQTMLVHTKAQVRRAVRGVAKRIGPRRGAIPGASIHVVYTSTVARGKFQSRSLAVRPEVSHTALHW